VIRVVVLVSGSGRVLQALLDAFAPDAAARGAIRTADAQHASIVAVISNVPDAYALERARRHGVPAVVVDHRGRSREAFEAGLAAAIDPYRPDLICLSGFLRILTPGFVARYPQRILNTHPALLPAFGGRGMYGERVHQSVLQAGVAVSGCTIHLVDDVPDGGPIVAQVGVPVLEGDTPETLAERIQAEERQLYPDVIRWWADGRIEVRDRAVLLRPAPAAPAEAPASPAHAVPT
jgi:phosphoribosylglycinamide formyltransferase-1